MNKEKLIKIANEIEWDRRYRTPQIIEKGKNFFLPEIFDLDLDFRNGLEQLKLYSGTLLDIGTGLGMQAIAFAKMNFTVTAIDVSLTALEIAKAKAKTSNLSIDFVHDSILRTRLTNTFDIITDRGCCTLFDRDDQLQFALNVDLLLNPKGYVLIKTDRKKGKDNILQNFHHYELISMTEGTYGAGSEAKNIKSLFFIFKKLEK